jgi:hypothetical protein
VLAGSLFPFRIRLGATCIPQKLVLLPEKVVPERIIGRPQFKVAVGSDDRWW